MIHNKRILITGGAGFLGIHLAESLAESNEVTLFDHDLNNALPYSRLAKDQKVRRIAADVRDGEAVREAVAGSQIVLHFASVVGVRKVIENARETIETAILGTRNVLEAARHNKQVERVINASSCEVYGNVMDAREGGLATVTTANDPRACYASAKLAAEHLAWAYYRDYGLPLVIVRPCNIYGPLRKTDNAVGRFAVRALAGKDIVVYGDGSQVRAWCYVDDFRDAVLSCMEQPNAIGEDFNLGNPRTAVTIHDLALRTIRLANSTSKVVTTPHVFSDIGVRLQSSSKPRDLLAYQPRFDLDTGLAATIAWYRDHVNDFLEWI